MGEKRHVRFYREGHEAWLFRALGVPPGSYDVEIVEEGGVARVRLGLDRPEPIVTAVRAWMRTSGPDIEEDYGNCVALVLWHPPTGRFIVTQKDLEHPKPECRLRFSLFAGSMTRHKETGEPAETPREAMLRELFEEVRDVEVGNLIAARMESVGSRTLEGVQWPGLYTCHVFVAEALVNAEFDRWMRGFLDKDTGMAEASAVMLTREEAQRLIDEERQSLGLHFLSSLHEVLASFL